MPNLYVDADYDSPWAMSAFVALRVKGIPFELRQVDLGAGDQRQPDYAARSLTRRVPTFEDGDFTLSESSAIAEYLEDAHPEAPRLFPADPHERARVRQVQAWLRSDLMALRQSRTTEVIFFQPTTVPLTEAARAAADKLFDIAGRLLGHDRGAGRDEREHIAADWSIADVDLATMLARLVLNGDPVPAPLERYTRRQWAHPAVQAWVALPRARR